jgi:hypothetical protein
MVKDEPETTWGDHAVSNVTVVAEPVTNAVQLQTFTMWSKGKCLYKCALCSGASH